MMNKYIYIHIYIYIYTYTSTYVFYTYASFPSHRATPSSHPFSRRDFPLNHPSSY